MDGQKMNWKQASSYYQSRLSDALSVQERAIELANLPQAEVPEQLKNILLQEKEPTRRQLERLKKGEFRIAVVGLEKAGKSTFINAWLDCDLLPAKGPRCTFTTTQIYSVKSESEQRLEVLAYTDEQFIHSVKQLETASAKEDLKTDLKTIKENEPTLQEVITKGNLTFPFTRLEEIREELKKYVADEKYAHAVREVRLYTNKLAQAEGIVFYDVPGLDSGFIKHVDEARQMLSDCDAVILIQRFINIRGPELEIIKFTEQGDKNVEVKDKLFVFLSHIDSCRTAEAFKEHIRVASEDWSKKAKLPEKRIVYGSAGAYLIFNNLAEKQTRDDLGKDSDMRNKLKILTDIADDIEATGIPIIKQRISDYINTERVDILEKRCEASIGKIIHTSNEIYHLVRQKFPENPEEAQRVEEENRQTAFSNWWKDKWVEKQAELTRFYNSSVINTLLERVNNDTSSMSSIEKFQERYRQLVKSEMQKLREETLREKENIFDRRPLFDSDRANSEWRDKLYERVRDVVDSLARQLAAELKDEALKLIDYMTTLLWGSSKVKEELMKGSEANFLALLEKSLSVLFLRFARPVAQALICGPVKSDTRTEIVKSLGFDIELIDNYYKGDEPAFQVLKKYVKYGAYLLVNRDLRQEVLNVTEIATEFIQEVLNVTEIATATEFIQEVLDESTPSRDAVTFEVTCDIKAFEEYLRNGIFEAAGFKSYCIQELKGLDSSFRDKDGTWTAVAQNEWKRENPRILAELPANLKSQEFNLEVSNCLRQLSISLKRFQSSNFTTLKNQTQYTD